MSKISIIKRILIVAILTLSATIVACVVSVFAFPNEASTSIEQVEINTEVPAGTPIKDLADLENMRNNINKGVNTTASYYLTANITIPQWWEPIGKPGSETSDHSTSFCGVFDGNGYTITMEKYGVGANNDDWDADETIATTANYIRYGLFCRVDSATIKNLYLSIPNDIDIVYGTGKMRDMEAAYFGGIAGYATKTKFTSCYVDFGGSVSINVEPRIVMFGGIVGRSEDGWIRDCVVEFNDMVSLETNYHAEKLVATDPLEFFWGVQIVPSGDVCILYFGGICGTGSDFIVDACVVILPTYFKFQSPQPHIFFGRLFGFASFRYYSDVDKHGYVYNENPTLAFRYKNIEGTQNSNNSWYSKTLIEWRDANYPLKFEDTTFIYSLFIVFEEISSIKVEEYKYSVAEYFYYYFNDTNCKEVASYLSNGGYSCEWLLTNQKTWPIQEVFAVVDVQIRNTWGNDEYIPNNVAENQYTQFRIHHPVTEKKYCGNISYLISSKHGYNFRGLSTSINYNFENQDGSTYSKQPTITHDDTKIMTVSDFGAYDYNNRCFTLYAMWELYPYSLTVETTNLGEIVSGQSLEVVEKFWGYGNSNNGNMYMEAEGGNNNAVSTAISESSIKFKAQLYLPSEIRDLYDIQFVNRKGNEIDYPAIPIEGTKAGNNVWVGIKYVLINVERVVTFNVYNPTNYNKYFSINVYNKEDQIYWVPNLGTLIDNYVLSHILEFKFGFNSGNYKVLGFTIGDGLKLVNGDEVCSSDKGVPKRYEYRSGGLYATYEDNTSSKINYGSLLGSNLTKSFDYLSGGKKLCLEAETDAVVAYNDNTILKAYTELIISNRDAGFKDGSTINIYPIVINDEYEIVYEVDGNISYGEYSSIDEYTEVKIQDNVVGWLVDKDKYNSVYTGYIINITTDKIEVKSSEGDIIISIQLDVATNNTNGLVYVKGIEKGSYGDVYLDAVLKGKIEFDWEHGEVVG